MQQATKHRHSGSTVLAEDPRPRLRYSAALRGPKVKSRRLSSLHFAGGGSEGGRFGVARYCLVRPALRAILPVITASGDTAMLPVAMRMCGGGIGLDSGVGPSMIYSYRTD